MLKKTHTKLLQLNNKTNKSTPQCRKYLNLRHFTKEDTDSKYKKRCSMSLIMREMQIIKMRHPFTPTRMAQMKKTVNTKCW